MTGMFSLYSVELWRLVYDDVDDGDDKEEIIPSFSLGRWYPARLVVGKVSTMERIIAAIILLSFSSYLAEVFLQCSDEY